LSLESASVTDSFFSGVLVFLLDSGVFEEMGESNPIGVSNAAIEAETTFAISCI
jgi:hypothetical protein